jgi:hypothetical protein
MTGNITIHEAEWATVCGHIKFTTNFTNTTYTLRIGSDMTLVADGSRELIYTNRADVLDILRQGDDAMWTWDRFMSMWIGWADCFSQLRRKRMVER